MRYGSGMKAAIIKRILLLNEASVMEISRETGVNAGTIYHWKKQASEGMLESGDGHVRPRDRNPGEKLNLILEGRSVSKEDRGQWLRSHGLHTEHLPLWEQEPRDIVTNKEKKQREEIAELKRKNKELQRELNRKEKALAETAALLTLKKSRRDLGGATRTFNPC